MAQDYTKQIDFSSGQVRITSSGNFPSRPKIGLVLSGGGSRGFSHVGVLKVLEKYGIVPDFIVGTSIGSVVGGLYAAGYPAGEIEQKVKSISWKNIFQDAPSRIALFPEQKIDQDRYLASIRLDGLTPVIPNAVTPGQRVLSILSDLFLMAPYQVKDNYDDLHIPFRTVATDILTGRMVTLSRGNLAATINGSLAVPLLFAPVPMDSMLLVDGGIKSNLPVSVAKKAGMDVIIASDVTAVLRSRDQINAPWEVADQVTTIMTDHNNLREYKDVDVLILPQIPKVTNTDFSKIDTMIAAGEHAARKVIQQVFQKENTFEEVCTDWLKVEHVSVFGARPNFPFQQKLQAMSDTLSLLALSNRMERWMKTGRYKSIRAHYDSTTALMQLSFIPFAQVDTIAISGNEHISAKELISLFGTSAGHRLNGATLKDDLFRLVSTYRKKGYSLMTITRVALGGTDGVLSIKIDEGAIDNVSVLGNKITRPYVILREFPFKRGHVFNWLEIKKSIENVYANQLFGRVNVDVKRKGRMAALIVHVVEKPSVRFQIGGKGDMDRQFQGYFEIADENFLGRGIKAGLSARLGLRDGELALFNRSDRIFTSNYTFSARSYFSWEVNPVNFNTTQPGRYREERLGVRLRLGRQIRRVGQLAAEIRWERVTDIKSEGRFVPIDPLELRVFALSSISDHRNRIDFPTKGINNYWYWESGSSALLNSQEAYSKIFLNLEGYYSTRDDAHTAHVRFRIGLADNSTPFSEQFRIGGQDDFFGLLKNQLFGRQMLAVSLEYRYRLHLWKAANIYLSYRYDLGGIWENSASAFKRDDFFSGNGISLGLQTLAGPLRVAWGKSSIGQKEVYLSFGYSY